MLPISSSRTEEAIRNEIRYTGKRIVSLCDEIGSLRASCRWYHIYGQILSFEEARERIVSKGVEVITLIDRRNKLGIELNKTIKKD